MSRPTIVLLGMLTKIPVGGVAWLVGQYAIGFERLGYDVYYVEAHARTPSMLMRHPGDDGTARAAAFLDTTMRRFGLPGRWAFHALHDDGRCLGLDSGELARLYRDAALIVNLHGGTVPLEAHSASGRLVYLGTDPVDTELEIAEGRQRTIDFLDQHVAHFTWGLNYGNADCTLPWTERYRFVPSPPPVVSDLWDGDAPAPDAPFTTVGNWRQDFRTLSYGGETLTWSKHHEFEKLIDLPDRVGARLELALATFDATDQERLEANGWSVRRALDLSLDADTYRDYIVASAGEFSAAKQQNVHFRTGWFSERSATYLAAGRPVVLQDTGFGNALPTGEGLFAFEDVRDAAEAIEAVVADPLRHRRAARELARAYLNYDVVLGAVLDHLGMPSLGSRGAPATAAPPAELVLTPRSRRPLVLDEATSQRVAALPIPSAPPPAGHPELTVVMVVLDNLVCTRLALESVLASTTTDAVPYEIVVVDNGSGPDTRHYLEALAARNWHVRLLRNHENRGFAPAVNQGVAASRGANVVLLNNDTVVPPGSLVALAAHLDDHTIGLVGPATNRCGNAAEVLAPYRTLGEMITFAAARSATAAAPFDLPVAVMFCVALRRAVFDAVGPLDERFEVGMFEDDDYARRVRANGGRVVCADDVFVHHFGEATIGSLGDRYGDVFAANRRRFETKWGVEWKPHPRRRDEAYAALRDEVRRAIADHTRPGAVIAVVSHGDDELLSIDGRAGWHFPRNASGVYAGHHPASDDDAIALVESARRGGAGYLAVPAPSMWWLDHYRELRSHVERRYPHHTVPGTVVIYDLSAGRGSAGPDAARLTDLDARADGDAIVAGRDLVTRLTPHGATIAVIAKDDPALLVFDGRAAVNFPRGADGKYLGYAFDHGIAATAHLECARLDGATHLFVPEWSRWWLTTYPELAAHLDRHGHVVADEAGVGLLADLRPRGAAGALGRRPAGPADLEGVLDDVDGARPGGEPVAVAWWAHTPPPPAGRHLVFPAARHGDGLAYLDDSVPVVAVDDAGLVAEASRVATAAVVHVGTGGPSTIWRPRSAATTTTLPPLRVVVAGTPEWRDEVAPWLDGFDVVAGGDDPFAAALAGADGGLVAVIEPGVVPLPGCLASAAGTLAATPRAGAVAVKLLGPDGALDAAGSTVFADGSLAGVAAGSAKVAAPWHEYVRPVDAATGVVVARRGLLADLEPPAHGASPAAFAAWSAAVWSTGAAVVYQPAAAAVRARAPQPASSADRDGLDKAVAGAVASRPVRPAVLDERAWRSVVARDDVRAGWIGGAP